MTRGAWRTRPGAVALLAAGLSCGCTRSAVVPPPVEVTWTLTPSSAVVGPATLAVTLRAPAGDAVPGARVHLEAFMSHPGMAPVIADATERFPGVYDLPFAFTMAGDWVLTVTIALPGGGRVERRITVANVRPSG